MLPVRIIAKESFVSFGGTALRLESCARWARLQPREQFPQSLQSIPTRMLEAPRDARSNELSSSPPCRPLAVLPVAQLQMPTLEMSRISYRDDGCRRPFSASSAPSALSALLLLRSVDRAMMPATRVCAIRAPEPYPQRGPCSAVARGSAWVWRPIGAARVNHREGEEEHER